MTLHQRHRNGLGFYEDIENGDTFETIDKELEECGMDEFLRDIYYEHPRSWEIGDYEDDFLTWEENTSTEETKEGRRKREKHRPIVSQYQCGVWFH